MYSTSDIRDRFLDFFQQRNHRIVASSSLVPGNDKTLLFTNAGMVQFKDVFTGAEKRDYVRAATAQRCVRAGGKHNDLDNVGYTARHHTFFEMLGNFSFGDYFKREAIDYAWQFLTAELNLPADRLWVTIFEEDDEAAAIWTDHIGLPAERVVRIGAKDNFWMMGDTGPCGPCSEIFYDHGPDVAGGPPGSPDEDGDRYIEIWNLVFMQFERTADGELHPLPRPCVDTGMGLERIAAVLQGVHSNYEIDLFARLIRAAVQAVESARSGEGAVSPVDLSAPSLKVIADHIRSCAFLIADGVVPSNEGRGYVLRRIIRRAVRHGHKLGAEAPFFHALVAPLVAEMGSAYPELEHAAARVTEQLQREEERFADTLSAGLRILDDEIARLAGKVIPGEVVFRLYDTYGFPVDLTADIARERDLAIDSAGFDEHMQAQRERARAASSFVATERAISSDMITRFVGYTHDAAEATVVEIWRNGERIDRLDAGDKADVVLDVTPFYAEAGGQVGDTGALSCDETHFDVLDTQKHHQAYAHYGQLQSGSLRVGDTVQACIDSLRRERIRRHHSATHLLHGALREILGNHVEQRGSLVSDEHLRFDFSHDGPVSDADMEKVERWVDREVRQNSAAEICEMPMQEALAAGAVALFGEKYGDVVRVVRLGERSTELCGGTHVGATGDLGAFKLVGETGVAAGVRRIEAVSGEAALEHIQQNERRLSAMASSLKASPADAPTKLEQLQLRYRELSRQNEQLRDRLSSLTGRDLASEVEEHEGVALLLHAAEDCDARALRRLLDSIKPRIGSGLVVLAGSTGDKASLLAWVSPDLHSRFQAGELLRAVATAMGGRGGGRAELAQGGAPSLEKLPAGFDAARAYVSAEKLRAS